ncbi:MAG: S4 domain-containing protein, partial [Natronospirillum sp.]
MTKKKTNPARKSEQRVLAEPKKPETVVEPDQSEKLQKVLARAGLGSRREMETAISAGRVEVNGLPATLGDRVTPRDRLVFDGRPIEVSGTVRRVLVYNKPEGEVCTRNDPEGRPTIFNRLPPAGEGRWISVGRLDI